MEESVIRALVTGVMLGIAGLIATLIWKAIRSVKSSPEASRRVKLLAMWGFGLGYVALAVSAIELLVPMVSLAVIVGAVYWVRKGMK